MKVLLISANLTPSPYPLYPLGMSLIAAALTRAGHEVLQSDLLQLNGSLEAVCREAERFTPEIVGISVRNIDNVNLMNEKFYIDNVRELVASLRGATRAKILLGGAGFSLIPQHILEATGADYGIVGEGEELAVEFVDNAARGIFPRERLIGPAPHLRGAAIGPALYDERLLEFYLQAANIVSIQTKRGCPHQCVYCTYPLLEGSTLRRRDPRAVVDDIERLRDRVAPRQIFFVDSVFNDDGGAYLEVVDEMLRRGVVVPWTCFIRPGGLTEAIVERMKRSGFVAAEVGADAACDVTLRGLGKDFTFRDILECNDLLAGQGIVTSHSFMFGGPGETRETVREGIDNILGLKRSTSFIFMGIRILPHTPLARLALREKAIAATDDLLHPVYYLSPAVERAWLEETLTRAFAGVRHCLFPPDAMDSSLQLLRKLGYTGSMPDLLAPAGKKGAVHAD